MRLPNALKAWAQDRKSQGYLLHLGHPDGASKAEFFLGQGFKLEEFEALTEALLFHAWNGEAQYARTDKDGAIWVVVGPLTCPSGKRPLVRSVWSVENGVPRLVTAYPW